VILSSGYNGAPRGLQHCNDNGFCYRQANGIVPGTQYERCKSVHAEQNAIAQAARTGIALIDSTIYVTDLPSGICAQLIVNAGIQKVVNLGTGRYLDRSSAEVFIEANIELQEVEETP
jgi:dCMP deaminase